MDFDAVLLLSFGGPEGPEQVRPFLENVTRGRNIPPERLDDVAEHYLHFGGVSPINGINRALIEQMRAELDRRGTAAAGLLRQPQLGAVRRGHRRARCATTVSAGPRCSPPRPGAATRAARSTTRTSPGRGPRSGAARRSWSSCASTSTTRCSWRCSPTASRRPPARCPPTCAPTRGWSSPRTRFRCAPTTRYGPRPVQQPGRLRGAAGRRGCRLRRLRPGVAVAVRAAAGAVAGTRRRRSPFGARRRRAPRR